MSKTWTSADIDAFKDVLGLDVPAERLDVDLQVFQDIAGEIRKLRALDLTEVHPAVIFRPDRDEDQ